MRHSLVFLGLALMLAPGCRAIGARTYNLRELHDEDGHHRRLARLMTDTDYLFQEGLRLLLRKDPSKIAGKLPKKIEDPLEVCVENLIALSNFEPRREGLAALQVEYFARYSAIDPWQISRQICLRQLGKAGARLKLAQHPPAPAQSTAIATPELLRDALAPLIRSLVPRAAMEPASDVAAACRAVGQLHFDLEGIQRALAAGAALLERQPAASNGRAALLELVLDLERRTVRLALERGLTDASPYVRAAAVEASVRANGSAHLAEVLPRLVSDADEEVPLTILELVRAHGLSPAKAGADDSKSAREGELALLIRVATEHSVDRVRVSAMATLGAVSGAGFKSLREEDWDAWWYGRNPPAPR